MRTLPPFLARIRMLFACLCLPMPAVGNLAWASGVSPQDASPPVFDSSYLLGSGQELDVSRFEREGPLPPGTYRVDVSVNSEWVGAQDIRFIPGDSSLEACLDLGFLLRAGVKVGVPDGADSAPDAPGHACRTIQAWIPHATSRLDSSELRLEIDMPQSSIRQHVRGYVDPADWDAGIPAGIIEYSASYFRTSGVGADQRSSFLGMTAGVNLGMWQLRHMSSLSWQDGGRRQWNPLATYVERPLPQWRSRLTVGERVSADPLLGAIGFRGAQLDSDERMFAESLRGFAPVVRGMAEGNARIEIRQHGSLLRSLNVAPGPFEIHDLYALSSGADLEVVVTEADGRVTRSIVPYAFNPNLIRAGTWRYRVVVGQVSESFLDGHPQLAAASAQYGFSNAFTGYGAAVSSDGYRSGLLGAAFNTRMGALSLDVATMRARYRHGGNVGGARWRASYNKAVGNDGAMLSVIGSHYPEPGFRELRDFLQDREDVIDLLAESTANPDAFHVSDFAPPSVNPVPAFLPSAYGRLRNSLQASISLPFGKGSTFHLNGFVDRYAEGGSRSGYQAGFRGYWGRASYALSAGRVSVSDGGYGNQYQLSVSVPLQRPTSSPVTVYATFDHRDAMSSQRIGLSGALGEEGELGYGMSLSRSDSGTVGAANLFHRLSAIGLNASASVSPQYRQVAFGAEGVAIFHAGGVTLGGQRGDTFALVEAPGAHGVRIVNIPGARIDRRGYGIVPSLLPYSHNVVELDPSTGDGVEIDGNVHTAIPYAGAVVRAKFESRRNNAILMHARRTDGRGLPFAAEVLNDHHEVVGVVGQGSQIYMHTAVADEGLLLVRWGPAPNEHCTIQYRWTPDPAMHGLRQFPGELMCRSGRE
ncbi:fimbria/pilus outer membrane usher protein [Luteimonas panaciterrae]|uniref:fimbria/pilus outer membrane usher protein n=1 Tax=Luteimonas panaciterrae TaxID=363885 RepID=UPI00299F1A3B|nr:fimbria/pilus outer membrane usher protein [Luteimonas panaciterrae]